MKSLLNMCVLVSACLTAGCGGSQGVITNDAEITADMQKQIDEQDAVIDEDEATYRQSQAANSKKK